LAVQHEPWTDIPLGPALEWDMLLKNGEVETVRLRSEADAEHEGVRVSALHPHPRITPKSLQREMAKHWKKAGGAGAPPAYVGLSPPAGAPLEGLAGSFEVGDTGLVLDVAQSLVAPGAGLGLFLRKRDAAAPDVVLPAGQAVCGYPAQISNRPVIEGGKTILFAMTSLVSALLAKARRGRPPIFIPSSDSDVLERLLFSVTHTCHVHLHPFPKRRTPNIIQDDELFYEGQLLPVGLVLDELGPGTELAAHTVSRDDATGCPVSVMASGEPHPPGVAFLAAPPAAGTDAAAAAQAARLEDPDAFRYLVPFRGADFFEGGGGRPPGVAGLGDQANDLALETGPDGGLRVAGKHQGVGGAEEYAKASLERNLLVSRPAVALVERSGGGGDNDDPKKKKKLLVPQQPLLIAQRSVTIANSEPMEVGHAYGHMHWEKQLASSAGGGRW
jgi:hypothetical protein